MNKKQQKKLIQQIIKEDEISRLYSDIFTNSNKQENKTPLCPKATHCDTNTICPKHEVICPL